MEKIRNTVNVCVTPSPFAEVQCEHIMDPADPEKIREVVIRSDISALLYTRKRKSISDISYNDLVAQLNNSHQSLLSQLDDTVSDEQILDSVKSRYIQSIGDITAYSDYLTSAIDHTTATIKESEEKEERFKALMEKLNVKSD